LTKKQKEEKAAAEIRRQALLASGVQIEGLQQTSGNGAPVGKKMTYGNRKKKGPVSKEVSSAPSSRPRTPDPAPVIPAAKEEEPVADDDVKDDWDASSGDDVTKASVDVKDSWDVSSEEEAESKPSEPVSFAKPAEPAAKPRNNGKEYFLCSTLTLTDRASRRRAPSSFAETITRPTSCEGASQGPCTERDTSQDRRGII
jgi:translation initiation factor 5B